jgi:small subunit ribosomal protein S20
LAHHKQAKKRIRQSERRRKHNQNLRSRMRTTIKSAKEALASGDAEAAQAGVRSAEREIRKAATKGIIPKNRASRTIGRLAKQLNARSA